jgi:integrase
MSPDTLTIDRTFRGVGRIKKATGTTNPAVRAKLSRMLTTLHQDGRLDILRAIRDGLPMLQVYDAFQRRTLDKLPVGSTAQLLDTAFGRWLDKATDYSDDHLRSLGASRKYLVGAIKGATVADLPRVLDKLRGTLGSTYPRSFNLARAAALAFVRSTLKRSHPLWLAVAAVEPRKVTAKRKRSPLTPVQVRNYFPAPETDPVDAIAWTMVTSGMHAKELWGEWWVDGSHIHIHGTKREGRDRDVPLIFPPSVPQMHRRTFENKLRERTGSAIVPYDLRRTYSNWMEAAGIPRTRRRMYMGHGAKDVTDLYEQHEVAAYLAEDADKLRRHAGITANSTAPQLRLTGSR